MEELITVGLCLLCFVTGAGDIGLFALVFPFWHARALRSGLATRRKEPWQLELAGGVVRVRRRDRDPESWKLECVVRARHAVNSNWTQSKMLDDGLTLFDARGRALVKVAAESTGFTQLLTELERRHVPVDLVEVEAPAYLD